MRRRGHPVRGALSGLLLGILGAIDLSLFNVRAPDSLTVIGLPAAGFVLGILLGMWAPFGGRRAEPVVVPAAAPPVAAPPSTSAMPAEPDPWVAREEPVRREGDDDEFPGRDE